MHTYVDNGVGTLAYLFTNYVVIKRILGWEDNNFLLLLGRRDLLGGGKLVLLVHRDDILGDPRDTCSCVSWRGFFRPDHVSYCINGSLWSNAIGWEYSCILLLIVLVARLTPLDDGSFDVSIPCSLICGRYLVLKTRNSKCATVWCSGSRSLSLVLWSTWLEEKVVNYHLSLIHIHWWNRCLVGTIRSVPFGEHFPLLLLQKLHVISGGLVWRDKITECIDHRLCLIELLILLSHSSGGFHGCASRACHCIFLSFIRQSSFVSAELRLSGLLLLWWGCGARSLKERLRLLVFLHTDSDWHAIPIIAGRCTRRRHNSASVWWKRLRGTEASRWHWRRSTRLLV